MNYQRKRFYFSDILIGVLFTVCALSLGVIFVVNFRYLYYLDIKALDIPGSTGLSSAVIMDNYNALINYNSPFFRGDLVFPTLPSSDQGLQHFREVKNIFVSFYYLFPITFASLIGIIMFKKKRKNYSYLLTSSITMIVLPLIVGIGAFLSFDTLFVVFHKIFFRNDYWLFDDTKDPIITLLPDTFFMHCAFFIAGILVVTSATLYVFYRIFHKKRSSYYR